MSKRSEGVLGKIAGLVGVGENERTALVLVGSDFTGPVTILLDGSEADVVARVGTVPFSGGGDDPAGLDPKELEARVLAFLDAAGAAEAAGQNRAAVLEAITLRGISILEPEAPQTRPAQPPEGGAAPAPDGGAPAQPPQTRPAQDPEVRTELADEKGLVALIVLREDGLPGAGGKFIAAGKRGKFPAEEAYAHLTAGNARLPTAED